MKSLLLLLLDNFLYTKEETDHVPVFASLCRLFPMWFTVFRRETLTATSAVQKALSSLHAYVAMEEASVSNKPWDQECGPYCL